MRLLITGGTGFLGRHVVARALSAGHRVRVLSRQPNRQEQWKGFCELEYFQTDLSVDTEIEGAFEGINAVIHMAASLAGTEQQQLQTTVAGTERLLNAMSTSSSKRLVLVSSLSVYDFEKIDALLTEESPLLHIEHDGNERGSYARSKLLQERIARELAERFGIQLCVIRPGFIYGPGNADIAGLGFEFGPLFFRVTGGKRLPLTYVENTADAIVRAVESAAAAGLTFNLTDSDGECPVRYTRELFRWEKRRRWTIPLPYSFGLLNARLARFISKLVFRGRGKLPGILVPSRFAARFKSLRFPNDRVRTTLNWQPNILFDEAINRTFPSERIS